MKTTQTYLNPLAKAYAGHWKSIEGSKGNLKELTLAIDPATGDYTRLTWFKEGYSTEAFGVKSHDYPEEIFVVSGRLYDEAFKMWLEPGHYASRPPGEPHGPFRAEGEVIILEVSYPSQSAPESPEAVFDIERTGERLEITMRGALDAEEMHRALDELAAKAEGIENGTMLYDAVDFRFPSLGAVGIEFSHLPSLFRLMGRFRRAALLSDKRWLKAIAEFEGMLIPHLEIKGFSREQRREAEAWLAEAAD